MNRTAVESSNIKSIGYDPSSQTLQVEFKRPDGEGGAVWDYADVPKEKFDELMKAGSQGSYFAREIKGKFDGKRA